MHSTRCPRSASATPRLSVVVVFATPPFWFASASTCGCATPFPVADAWAEAERGRKRAIAMSRSIRVSARRSFTCSCRRGSVVTSALLRSLLSLVDGLREPQRGCGGAAVALHSRPRLCLAYERAQLAEEPPGVHRLSVERVD